MDVAIDQLGAGLGFVFEAVWFRRDGGVLRCEAMNPLGARLREAQALELIHAARDTLERLVSASTAFGAAVAHLTPEFAVIDDYGTGSVVLAEVVDDKLEWHLREPTA
jgi:hypothetical protein